MNLNFESVKEEIENSPTVPLPDDSHQLMNKLLKFSTSDAINTVEYASLIYDLISKLSANFSHVNNEQSQLILTWVDKHWEEKDLGYVDLLVSILVNISPELSKIFIEEKLNISSCDKCIEFLKDALSELDQFG